MTGRRPVSTYRLQLGAYLTFDDAADLTAALAGRGVSDLYLSPILAAAPGSTHGYDVVDHTRISDVLGGRDGFERLVASARQHDLGIIVDVVPNHMAVPTPASHNRQLWSLLEHGPDSPVASWFDVDFADDAQVLMPILGQRVGAAMAAGEITVRYVDEPENRISPDRPVLCYYEHRFPIRAGTENLPLAEMLQRQHYRLAYWRVADEELNYRRFFDVGSLVAVRVERPEVFEATHALIFELMDAGLVDGLRIDHPDGLADPREYLQRLHERTGGAWTVAEKILEPDEGIPQDWLVAGTTGYDAAWRVNQVLVDPAGAAPLGALMSELASDGVGTLPAVVSEAKREIATGSLYAEVHRLATLLAQLCDDDVRLRDHTLRAITDCVTELVVACDRYRAYVVPGSPLAAADAELVESWSAEAAQHLEPERLETLEVVTDLVLGREVGSAGRQHEARRDEVIIRFQQVCGAVMAKGVEDTAFYRWTHLTSLCEVGGNPHRFAVGPDALHAWASRTQLHHPLTMTAASTHDAKRGEDVRARIGVLSEFGETWVDHVHALREATERSRPGDLDGRTENLLWQTLAGTWTETGPISAERLTGYLVKAAREAKQWTTWTGPDDARESALGDFVTDLLSSDSVHELMSAWVERTREPVRAATLAAKAVQLTLPGVADVYQGTEITTVALVDPDNRRAVDHAHISTMLDRLDEGANPHDLATEKLRLTTAVLRLRRRRPEAFVGSGAGYHPLPTSTTHAVAFARTDHDRAVAITVVTRLSVVLRTIGGWGEHTVVLPEGQWRDVVTGQAVDGGSVPLVSLLSESPVAVLERADISDDEAPNEQPVP
ncbi:malto-oligosyltrehalose synthase [Ruania halotolerans]|uniref:malto-oligosyltrehalose synthase n=1 Tax=Ruania halotolerans TaxID=2897773 RepID=UPI001E3094A3|nr:malto-oligosyltrehalose synthase [Ruania halotolerans]UFU04782.1 malto-oligosyltrehalose synthase [Ruania halotolerans]